MLECMKMKMMKEDIQQRWREPGSDLLRDCAGHEQGWHRYRPDVAGGCTGSKPDRNEYR